MPYIVVTGSLCTPHLAKADETVIYGLDRHERAAFTEELNILFKTEVASLVDAERVVKISRKGLTLVVVNRLHASLGYDVISHSMAMTNTNRELVSWTMYKKSLPDTIAVSVPQQSASVGGAPVIPPRTITANIIL